MSPIQSTCRILHVAFYMKSSTRRQCGLGIMHSSLLLLLHDAS